MNTKRVFAAGCRAAVLALLSGCTWPGGGFNASGPEMPRLAQALDLRPGMVVADVGAGRGQLTLALAAAVGPGGHVFSSEIDPGRLRALRDLVGRASNVTLVEAKVSDSGLPAGCCDAIVLRRVYHHVENPRQTNASLLQALRPGGVLAVIDLPPPFLFPDRSSFGVASRLVVDEVTASGFELQRLHTDWPGRGPFDSYCALFRKPRVKPAAPRRARGRSASPARDARCRRRWRRGAAAGSA